MLLTDPLPMLVPVYSVNPSRAARELDEDFDAWAAGLLEDERAALSYYQFGGYEELNKALRALGSPEPAPEDTHFIESFSDEELDELMQRAEAIGRAIGKARLPDSVRVYRGFRDRAFLKYFATDELVGRAFHDKAFVSSSIARERAERFVEREKGFLLEFVCPASRNLAVGLVSGSS